MRKTLYRILENHFDDIVIIETNFDQNKELCKAHNVYGVPTLLIMTNNKILNRYSGILDSQEIKYFLDQSLGVSG